jgi:hypothetical protein
VQRWCAARVPEHARHQVRVECEIAARHLTIVERRAPWREDFGPEWTSFPIARLRYTTATKLWTLFWRDRNLNFHAYDLLAPSPSVEDLLAELDRDPPASSGANHPRSGEAPAVPRCGTYRIRPSGDPTLPAAQGPQRPRLPAHLQPMVQFLRPPSVPVEGDAVVRAAPCREPTG